MPSCSTRCARRRRLSPPNSWRLRRANDDADTAEAAAEAWNKRHTEPGALERLEAWLTANPDALPELCRSYSAETDTTDFAAADFGVVNGEMSYGFGPTLAAAIDAFLQREAVP